MTKLSTNRRVIASVILAFAAMALMLLTSTGSASAGEAGAGDCLHAHTLRFDGGTDTIISVPLPFSTGLGGWTEQLWLYRSDGSQWVDTGGGPPTPKPAAKATGPTAAGK